MRHSERMERGVIYTAAVLLCLVLASFWVTGNIYARYTATAGADDAARAAIFGHNETIELPSDWTESLVPGSEKKVTLTVSNQNNGKVSETAQKYHIEVVTAGNLPLEFSMVKGNDNSDTGTAIQETKKENSHTYTDNDMFFQADIAATHQYALTVKWPADKNAAALAELPDYVQIKICVEQID